VTATTEIHTGSLSFLANYQGLARHMVMTN